MLWEGIDSTALESLSSLFELAASDSTDTEEPALVPPVDITSKLGYGYFRGFRIRYNHDGNTVAPSPKTSCEFMNMFEELGFDLSQGEISEWLESDTSDSGVQVYTDMEICDLVTKKAVQEEPCLEEEEEDDEDEDNKGGRKTCPVSNSDAAHYFEQCTIWLEHQPEASVYNLSLLRELQS